MPLIYEKESRRDRGSEDSGSYKCAEILMKTRRQRRRRGLTVARELRESFKTVASRAARGGGRVENAEKRADEFQSKSRPERLHLRHADYLQAYFRRKPYTDTCNEGCSIKPLLDEEENAHSN